VHASEADREYNANKRPLYHALYASSRWKRMRITHLSSHPFCARCNGFATIAHHVAEHKGDPAKFYNAGNLESLCVACHNREHERGAPAHTGAG
jgi:5-methylcytosine-specific restriction enzyme A